MLGLPFTVALGIVIGWVWQPIWAAPFVAYVHSLIAKARTKSEK